MLADEQHKGALQNSKAAPLWHRIKSTRNNLAAYGVYADYAACVYVLSLGRTLTGDWPLGGGRWPSPNDRLDPFLCVCVRTCLWRQFDFESVG